MPVYQTFREAISSMRYRGFVNTFTIQHQRIFCPELDTTISPGQLTLLEQHTVQAPTLEGQREVYGFRTANNELGIMTDTYATYDPQGFTAIIARCHQAGAGRA
ncbi:hypothetical protein [Pontibacter ruber]|uniref:Uncharacterized protein n=1 Tax=Pontibacter ruber TaxID=1343895 RepID=A0ABW5CVX4_9BACT|nr:hypothetical protein [Pontibacter ruber]